INAKSITIGGVIKGDVIAPEGVHLLSSSIVIGDIQTHHLQADKNVLIQGHCIALSDDSFYNEAVQKWQDKQAIASASILKDMKINLPDQQEPSESNLADMQESEWK
ncbi:MAG: polymer-forming cytoskeletal protein, partial [Treponema sp.]|nr:polymer-forming cytoskeletal protein [Treponema sp.]